MGRETTSTRYECAHSVSQSVISSAPPRRAAHPSPHTFASFIFVSIYPFGFIAREHALWLSVCRSFARAVRLRAVPQRQQRTYFCAVHLEYIGLGP